MCYFGLVLNAQSLVTKNGHSCVSREKLARMSLQVCSVRICPVLWSAAKDLLILSSEELLAKEVLLTRSSKDRPGSSRIGLIQCGECSATDSMLSICSVEIP